MAKVSLRVRRHGWASSQNSDAIVEFGDPISQKSGMFYRLRYIFLCFWPYYRCTCTEKGISIYGPKSDSAFSKASISLIGWKFRDLATFLATLAVFLVHMYRKATCAFLLKILPATFNWATSISKYMKEYFIDWDTLYCFLRIFTKFGAGIGSQT